MPASASMYSRSKPLPRPGEYSSSQSSYPSPSTSGASRVSKVSLSIVASFRCAETKNGPAAHSFLRDRPGPQANRSRK